MMVGPNEVVTGDHDKAGFNGVMGVTVAQKWSQYVAQREKLEATSVSNSFKEFCSKGKVRDEAVTGGRIGGGQRNAAVNECWL